MTIEPGLLKKAGEWIGSAERIRIVCHMRPDGDAIGSLLGLGLALEAVGKQVQMISVDGVPASLCHLEGTEKVTHIPSGQSDLVCIVDCSDLQRAGDIFPAGFQPDINFDHHITNLNFARLNLVNSKVVSTTQLIATFLDVAKIPITKTAAEALLTGLITDTIGFRTNNITPEAMRLAARLMELGANLSELYRKALVTRSFEAARLWGAGLSTMEREDRLVWTVLTAESRQIANYPGRDDADLVNVLSAITDADIAVIFIEQSNGHIKVSWRSQPGFDVSDVALNFGGGGHAAAAGANIPGKLQDVQQSVLAATRLLLMEKTLVRQSDHIIE